MLIKAASHRTKLPSLVLSVNNSRAVGWNRSLFSILYSLFSILSSPTCQLVILNGATILRGVVDVTS